MCVMGPSFFSLRRQNPDRSGGAEGVCRFGGSGWRRRLREVIVTWSAPGRQRRSESVGRVPRADARRCTGAAIPPTIRSSAARFAWSPSGVSGPEPLGLRGLGGGGLAPAPVAQVRRNRAQALGVGDRSADGDHRRAAQPPPLAEPEEEWMGLPLPTVRVLRFRCRISSVTASGRSRRLGRVRPPRDRWEPRRASRLPPVERLNRDCAVLRRRGQPAPLPEVQKVQPALNVFVHRSRIRSQTGPPATSGPRAGRRSPVALSLGYRIIRFPSDPVWRTTAHDPEFVSTSKGRAGMVVYPTPGARCRWDRELAVALTLFPGERHEAYW